MEGGAPIEKETRREKLHREATGLNSAESAPVETCPSDIGRMGGKTASSIPSRKGKE